MPLSRRGPTGRGNGGTGEEDSCTARGRCLCTRSLALRRLSASGLMGLNGTQNCTRPQRLDPLAWCAPRLHTLAPSFLTSPMSPLHALPPSALHAPSPCLLLARLVPNETQAPASLPAAHGPMPKGGSTGLSECTKRISIDLPSPPSLCSASGLPLARPQGRTGEPPARPALRPSSASSYYVHSGGHCPAMLRLEPACAWRLGLRVRARLFRLSSEPSACEPSVCEPSDSPLIILVPPVLRLSISLLLYAIYAEPQALALSSSSPRPSAVPRSCACARARACSVSPVLILDPRHPSQPDETARAARPPDLSALDRRPVWLLTTRLSPPCSATTPVAITHHLHTTWPPSRLLRCVSWILDPASVQRTNGYISALPGQLA